MSTTKTNILLVEDEPSLINLYQTVLGKEYNIDIAENYEFAKQSLDEKKHNLVLLDIIIPAKRDSNLDYTEKVGFNLLKIIKNIPVIVLTNLSSPQDRKIAKDLGAKDFVVKANILPNELLKKIKKVLKNEKI